MRTGKRARQDGFTYLGLIILVTVIGMVGAATLKIDALLQRAAKEEELLEIGAAFSAALQSYAAATPRGQPTQPPSLRELLKDPRTPGVRRHLRKIFVDPMTGKDEWGIAYLGGTTGVVAVYSLSQAAPFKVGNFDARFVGFENRQHVSEWRFTAGGLTTPQIAEPLAAARIEPPPPPPPPPSPPPEEKQEEEKSEPVAPPPEKRGDR